MYENQENCNSKAIKKKEINDHIGQPDNTVSIEILYL